MVIKINPTDLQSTINFIEEVWNKHLHDHPFDYAFVDEYFDKIYKHDADTGKLFGSFSIIAIIIACLGLLGLISFTVEQKTKEIGVRKVLGASISSIVILLSKEFIKWVIISCAIAFPAAYFLMRDWLGNFVYKTEIQFTTFVIAGLLVVFIAFSTICFQAIKAAIVNPVRALRYE